MRLDVKPCEKQSACICMTGSWPFPVNSLAARPSSGLPSPHPCITVCLNLDIEA